MVHRKDRLPGFLVIRNFISTSKERGITHIPLFSVVAFQGLW